MLEQEEVIKTKKEQQERVIESLVEFVERTSKDKKSPPEAFAALPEVARLLFDITYLNVT